jgi:ribonuclease HII
MTPGTTGPAPLTMGLDEAGRGPGLGQLVLCAVALDEEVGARLVAMGVRDSKAFGSSDKSKAVRARLAAEIERLAAFVGYEVCEVPEIDAYVSRGGLNELEREKAEALIRRAPACGRIIADGKTLFGPLTARYPALEAKDRAEAEHVAVAAASVCAKARRDALFAAIAERYAPDFGPLAGGGYVNPKTQAFIAEYRRRFGQLPPEARKSWPWPGIS